MDLIYEDISSLTIDTKILLLLAMLNHKSDIRRRSLPSVEIFWSVCDDRLPIVELLEWPVIKNLYEVRIFVLIIYQKYARKLNACVLKYTCTFYFYLSKHVKSHEVETEVNALKG